MTTKWLSYQGVPLQGHLHVADQQQKKWSVKLRKNVRKSEVGPLKIQAHSWSKNSKIVKLSG